MMGNNARGIDHFLQRDKNNDVVAIVNLEENKKICSFDFRPISHREYAIMNANSFTRKVMCLPCDKDDRYILGIISSDISPCIELGNYIRQANSNEEPNCKLVWGQSEEFLHAIFVTTIKPVSKSGVLLLDKTCESYCYRFAPYLAKVTNLQKPISDDERIVSIQESLFKNVWCKLFGNKVSVDNKLFLIPGQTKENLLVFYDISMEYLAGEIGNEQLEERIRKSLRFTALLGNKKDDDYMKTAPNGLCWGVAALQVFKEKDFGEQTIFKHIKHNTHMFEFLAPVIEHLKYYLTMVEHHSDYEDLYDACVSSMNFIQKKKYSGFTESNFQFLLQAIYILKNREVYALPQFSMIQALDLYPTEHQVFCLGQPVIYFNSILGAGPTWTIDELVVLVDPDVNYVSFDGSHYWNIFSYRHIKMNEQLDNSFKNILKTMVNALGAVKESII